MLLQIRVDGSRIAEIERALAIHETVFRHLLVLHEAGADVDDAAAAGADGDVVRLRQTAVAPDADDEDEKEDEDDEQPAAVLAANEEAG
jgi:hypothetical protein